MGTVLSKHTGNDSTTLLNSISDGLRITKEVAEFCPPLKVVAAAAAAVVDLILVSQSLTSRERNDEYV